MSWISRRVTNAMKARLPLMAASLLTGTILFGQNVWAPKGQPAVYKAPHKPHTKLKEVKAKHAGHDDWPELLVGDQHLRSEDGQAKPGSGVKRAIHPDTREWWVVLDGEVKFDIESVGVVNGKKGAIIQVPMQTFFSWEAVGGKPLLMFDTNIAGA